MKIQEFRNIIKAHKRADLEIISAELYKAIPKNKIEDRQLDEFIKKPKKDIKGSAVKPTARSIKLIKLEIDTFVEDVKAQNYLVPNRSVPKAQRSKWRFLVKNFYKEILGAEKNGDAKGECALALRNLYEALCYACHYQCFTAYDVFESIGIEQTVFFDQIVKFYRESLDINDFIFVSIRLIIDNSLNRYTIYSELMSVFFNYCQSNDTKEKVVSTAKEILEKVKAEPDKKDSYSFGAAKKDSMSYEKIKKINNIIELIFRAHCLLHEYEKGIEYFRKNYFEGSKEILLYIIIRNLLSYKNHEIVLKEIERNMDAKPREAILKVKDYILKNNKLPEYI